MRKGMMLGRGKGYRNVIPHDRPVHQMSAKGIKQPQLKGKFLIALKGWVGHDKKELIAGKYRPVFASRPKDYFVKKTKPKDEFSAWLNRDRVTVPATKTNLKKMVAFNKIYGEMPYKEAAKKIEKKYL